MEQIINGVDVSGCYDYTSIREGELYCHREGTFCKNLSDCVYKQLQQLKQENEELKKTVMTKCPQCGEYLSPVGLELYEEITKLKELNKANALSYVKYRDKYLKEIEDLKKELKHKEEMNIKIARESIEVNKNLGDAIDEIVEQVNKCNNCKGKRTTIKKYKKKPVVIEAIQFDGENYAECGEFLNANPFHTNIAKQKIYIKTLEGEITASKNDYIIKGVKGEFYPCKPDIFKQTYDEE